MMPQRFMTGAIKLDPNIAVAWADKSWNLGNQSRSFSMDGNYEASLFRGPNLYRVSGPKRLHSRAQGSTLTRSTPEMPSARDLMERVEFYDSNIINSENNLLMSIYNRENG
jgi:hypothetical protein